MLPLLVLGLAAATAPVLAQKPGSFKEVFNTQVSAMMMFVGNDEKVYIIDKAEGNAARINDHPAWGAVWDIGTDKVDLMDIKTNVFCASGMHLPNGSFATFGGNGAIGPGGNIGSVRNNRGGADFDETYKNFDGTRSIRVLNPCKKTDNFASPDCQWFDDPSVLAMQKQRWYSAAEPLGDGTIALIGGFVNGGYVNRNFPNVDPEFEGGAAESTFEFYPPRGPPVTMQFMIKTSGLNSYAHTYLLSSGKMLVQANISTMIWDPATNAETPLPDMPKNVARVYPASGAVAMLPLTPENNYNPTVLFCGGSDMAADDWGNYSFPFINTWDYPASKDCQRLTAEPAGGAVPAYEQDDDMLETRTMGQFVILPTGKLLVVNGAINGTAGYAEATGQTPTYGQMPFGMSLANGFVGRPAIYDPDAPKGSRWSNAGFDSSPIPRLYHSTALVLPDTSVLIAGSNPNVDVNLTTTYPTEYRAEVFYPSYYTASRPAVSGIPDTLSYGGNAFDVTIPSSAYAGNANDAAESAYVGVLRTGWTTHAMNFGQRYLKLKNTYTVNQDGSITLHVSQMPPNANIFQPGPAFVHVIVNGVPSTGHYVIVGNGQLGQQPTAAEAKLPDNVRLDSAKGSGSGNGNGNNNGASTMNRSVLIGAIAGGVALLLLIGTIFAIFIARRRRAASAAAASSTSPKHPRQPMSVYEDGQGTSYGRPGGNGYAPASTGAPSLSMGAYGVGESAGASKGGVGAPFASNMNADYPSSFPQYNPNQNRNHSPNLGAPHTPYGSDVDNRSMRSTGALIERTASPHGSTYFGDDTQRRY